MQGNRYRNSMPAANRVPVLPRTRGAASRPPVPGGVLQPQMRLSAGPACDPDEPRRGTRICVPGTHSIRPSHPCARPTGGFYAKARLGWVRDDRAMTISAEAVPEQGGLSRDRRATGVRKTAGDAHWPTLQASGRHITFRILTPATGRKRIMQESLRVSTKADRTRAKVSVFV